MKTDDVIIKYIFDKYLPIFCKLNIHPNIITFIALILSALLPLMHLYKYTWLVFASIIIRQLCDCLDGSVARKCEKTSKLGGLLDTIADLIFFYSLGFIMMSFFIKGTIRTWGLTTLIITGFLVIHLVSFDIKVMYDHADVKEYNSSSIYKTLFAFGTNNSLIIFTLIAIIYLIKMKIL